MASRVFLSYAHDDRDAAMRAADILASKGIEPLVDRLALSSGESFITFMEEALATSDYCLLLWSARAAERQWVEIEWQAALHRSVSEHRAFLVVGRLDQYPVPLLLRPRLTVELHPTPESGLQRLVETWHADRAAEQRTVRPVGSPPSQPAEPPPGEPLYVTSLLFGITVPWQANLSQPAGVLLDSVCRGLSLPRRTGQAPLEFVVDYELTRGDDVKESALDRTRPLSEQGVTVGCVLWLQTITKPVTDPVSTTTGSGTMVFRGESDQARSSVMRQIRTLGLGR
jgi:hypothetical protein